MEKQVVDVFARKYRSVSGGQSREEERRVVDTGGGCGKTMLRWERKKVRKDSTQVKNVSWVCSKAAEQVQGRGREADGRRRRGPEAEARAQDEGARPRAGLRMFPGSTIFSENIGI